MAAPGPPRPDLRVPRPRLPAVGAWRRAGADTDQCAHLSGCWAGVTSRPPRRSGSLPLHAQTSAQAGTQTSNPCTSSTVGAPGLTVVLILYAEPPPRCLLMDPTRDRHHPPADGCSLPVPASGAVRGSGQGHAGIGRGSLTRCGARWCQSSSAWGQSGSEDPLQHLARDVEAAAAAAPCHFPRAAPYSLRSRMGAPAWGPREQSPSV